MEMKPMSKTQAEFQPVTYCSPQTTAENYNFATKVTANDPHEVKYLESRGWLAESFIAVKVKAKEENDKRIADEAAAKLEREQAGELARKRKEDEAALAKSLTERQRKEEQARQSAERERRIDFVIKSAHAQLHPLEEKRRELNYKISDANWRAGRAGAEGNTEEVSRYTKEAVRLTEEVEALSRQIEAIQKQMADDVTNIGEHFKSAEVANG
jgi:predicted  nucleic acid-binding Zn-ribbon protein